MKKHKKAIYFGIILLFGYLVFIHFRNRNILRNDAYWTTGVIIEERGGYRGTLVFVYEFYDGEDKYRGEASSIGLYSIARRDFIGKSFPVVYYSENPGLNKMLITPYDFKYCASNYPDSLNWVLEYLR
jgi:hypothetical protein